MSDPSKLNSVLIPGPSDAKDVISLGEAIALWVCDKCVEMGRGETLEFPVPGTQ
jgi:hypothetical protein